MAKTVAVIGASNTRSKYGNKAVRAFRQQGYTVVPINPHELQVEGLAAYASVLDVPHGLDMATFYVPPEIGLQVIEHVAARKIPARTTVSSHARRSLAFGPSLRAASWESASLRRRTDRC
jgi:predicted CoA-binding protein